MKYRKALMVIIIVVVTLAILYVGASWLIPQIMQGHMPRPH